MPSEMAGEGKKANSVMRVKKCQLRQPKCFPLEPVLENSVAKVDEAPRKQPGKQTFKGKSVFSRLRDGYVKMMNDMASSADLTGVSAMYGCSTGQVDYPNSMRATKEDEEIEEQMAASQKARNKH